MRPRHATARQVEDRHKKMPATPASPYTRQNPFPAKLGVNRSLCGEGSKKDTRHFEIDLTGWGLNYEVGDSMTVWPTNDPALVDELIKTIGARGDEEVKGPNGPKTLREVLLRDCRITQTTPKFLKTIAERAVNGAPLLSELLKPERKQDLDTYLWGMEVIDFLIEHPSIKWMAQEFVDMLAKLMPRLYSISSSLKAHPEQVHFTIDIVHYESRGRMRKGVCSTFLAERAEKVAVPVFPNTSKFRLPEDGNTPIIMVGPGTGVAPFRAYLQERRALGTKGKNWLFFGSQHEHCNYFYKEELAELKRDGVLSRLDCAWSRDQADKAYVQHKMLNCAAEIWKWMDGEGAHFFVCGDARRMAKDVDAALRKIIQEQGGKSESETNEYVEKLKSDKRYKRDVY
ncbi:MAG TPA: sulfite reductase subunit alpha [Chthoniobacterales bacterium]|nr:sulfite reductase subunit alpha [Chthoniobacterales bacterium]